MKHDDLPFLFRSLQRFLQPFPLREEEPRITVTIQRDDSGIVVINRIHIIILIPRFEQIRKDISKSFLQNTYQSFYIFMIYRFGGSYGIHALIGFIPITVHRTLCKVTGKHIEVRLRITMAHIFHKATCLSTQSILHVTYKYKGEMISRIGLHRERIPIGWAIVIPYPIRVGIAIREFFKLCPVGITEPAQCTEKFGRAVNEKSISGTDLCIFQLCLLGNASAHPAHITG